MSDLEFDTEERYYYAVVEVQDLAQSYDRSMVGERSTEAETADWVLERLGTFQNSAGTVLSVHAYEDDGEGHSDPVFRVRGSIDQVRGHVENWRGQWPAETEPDRARTESANAFAVVDQAREQGMSR